ncbi:hypothetical protein ACHAXN_003902 [Cyclotella atomus]
MTSSSSAPASEASAPHPSAPVTPFEPSAWKPMILPAVWPIRSSDGVAIVAMAGPLCLTAGQVC